MRGAAEPLLRVEGLTVNYPGGRAGWLGRERLLVHAVDDVSFTISQGETLGLVGETGSGKTTTGRAVLRRVPLTSGRIWFDGHDITEIGGRELRRLRARMQLVFQDPYASLNPRMTVGDIVAEPLVVHHAVQGRHELRERVRELLRLVGLPPDAASRYPMAFSGGQRQRIGIARALALRPDLVVADEPVSALDVSIRAQVVNLMQDLQEQLGLAYLFIAHDLAVVRHISHRVAIMYAGRIVELAGRDDIYERPLHPYTRALLSAVPIPDPATQRERRRVVLRGEIPSPIRPPAGCRFHTRCPLAEARCRVERPPLVERHPGHRVACWLA